MKENKINHLEARCKSIFRSKKGISKLGYENFKNWYLGQNSCEYCGLTESESELLYKSYPECTRGGKRGKRLELDRRNPFIPYEKDISNFVLACYWCNNAKTNYFTYEEFKQTLGPAIGIINKQRINAVNKK